MSIAAAPAVEPPLMSCHGAWRGTYGIVYRIDDETLDAHVVDVGHRAEVYRPH